MKGTLFDAFGISTEMNHDISNALAESCFINSIEAIMVLDSNQRVLCHNPRSKEMFGNIENQLLSEILSSDSCADLKILQEAGVAENCVVQVNVKGGGVCSAVITTPDPLRTVIRIMPSSFKHLRYDDKTNRLISLGRMSGELAHAMSNPLAVIQGRLELLSARQGGLDNYVDRQLGILMGQCRKIGWLLQNLQVLSKSQLPRWETIQAKDIFDQLFLKLSDKTKKLKVNLEILPEDLSLCLDPVHFLVANYNLLFRLIEMNITATELTAQVFVEDNHYRFRYIMDGESPPEQLLKTFENADHLSEIPDGSVGYAFGISYLLIHEMQGRFQLKSRDPGGAEVNVSFPVEYNKEVKREKVLSNRNSLKIMVVDDHYFLRETLTSLLSNEGHHIIGASSAENALLSLEQEQLDVILVDIRLPGMSGEDFVDHLQHYNPSLVKKVLFISGMNYEPPDGVPFLRKPFTINQLLEQINLLIA